MNTAVMKELPSAKNKPLDQVELPPLIPAAPWPDEPVGLIEGSEITEGNQMDRHARMLRLLETRGELCDIDSVGRQGRRRTQFDKCAPFAGNQNCRLSSKDHFRYYDPGGFPCLRSLQPPFQRSLVVYLVDLALRSREDDCSGAAEVEPNSGTCGANCLKWTLFFARKFYRMCDASGRLVLDRCPGAAWLAPKPDTKIVEFSPLVELTVLK